MMMLSEACKAMQGQLKGVDKRFYSVELDTRRLEKYALYFAIHGASKNGHAFIQQAIDQQAAAAVVDEAFKTDDQTNHIKVDDTTIALGTLGAYWRARFTLPVIGITGSNGKTTVANILSTIFARHLPGIAPQGSFNNQWGVPLTLLKLRDEHQSAVIEMGMNHAGELTYLGHIVKPTIGLITNAAAAHLQGLKDIEAIAKAKGELINTVATNGAIVLNRDDRFYQDWRRDVGQRQVITFGYHREADVQLLEINATNFTARIFSEQHNFSFQLLGKHNALNAAAAIAVATAVDTPLKVIKAGLKEVTAVKGRLNIRPLSAELTLIDDSYNANQASMRAAINVLARYEGQKILVLGAMGEQGSDSNEIHRQVGAYARSERIDYLLTLVDQSDADYLRDMAAYKVGFGHNSWAFSNLSSLLEKIQSLTLSSTASTVLIKGSLFTNMGRVVDVIQSWGGKPC